jgi:hypothetical protein
MNNNQTKTQKWLDEQGNEVSKAQTRAKFIVFLNKARPEVDLQHGSDEFDFCILVTRNLPVVYSELERSSGPRFAVKLLKTPYKNGVRTLCIWNSTKQKWIPLSLTKIFTEGSKSSKKKRVQSAFRTAVKGQIDYVRASTTVPFECPLTGLWIEDKSFCEVDHAGINNFQKLLEQWMNLHSMHYDLIALDRKGDIKDADVYKSWYDFHKKHAVLQLVEKSANRRKGAKGHL